MTIVPALIKRPRKHLITPAEADGDRAKRQELEAAKQILAEVFSTRPSDVDEMIKKRLENSCDSDLVGFTAASLSGEERKRCGVEDHERWGSWPEMLQI